ncbi:MAG: tRNA (N6-isopentenyl adenosine(37)-C2)-methylthiotransferase MiaB [Clostridiales bacterium]|nr:tRNA (N6-isopentenyl adenosine(37)-C2)-methylthiotransferase MiaB [Clostridiales bacterium]
MTQKEKKPYEIKEAQHATREQNRLETVRQFEYMERLKGKIKELEQEAGHPLKACVNTFGCQMNARDSEKMIGILHEIGYTITPKEEDADFILYNTCTVRENANERVYGRLGHIKHQKKEKPHLMVALCGCMMQEEKVIETIQKKYSFVDIVFGTHNVFKLAELLWSRLESDRMIIDIWKDTDQVVENLPSERKYSFKAGVNIMYGCNNFCSYCIVPYVRGRERSRLPEDIIDEVTRLAEDGVKEIMLLGQNVNSYGKNLAKPMSFASLLAEVEKVPGIERIRFMTSHPKDLSDELIEVMSRSDKICRHLHLPLQSGSTRLLQIMNRKYTKEDYLLLVKKIRNAIPDISLTTDIIVGFPGETEEDFQETLDVVRQAEYDSAYTFIYSKRTGTPAAAMENQVPEDVVKDRFDRLLQVVSEVGANISGKDTGKVMTALIEEQNSQNPELVTGRLSNNMLVHLKGTVDMIGNIYPVRLDECKGFYYLGSLANEKEGLGGEGH